MFTPSPPSAALSESGVEGVRGRGGPETAGTSVDGSDSGDETVWLVLVTRKSEDDGAPVRAMSPRVGMGEDDHGTPEGVRGSVRY